MLRYFLPIALVAFLLVLPNHLCNYGRGLMQNISVK